MRTGRLRTARASLLAAALASLVAAGCRDEAAASPGDAAVARSPAPVLAAPSRAAPPPAADDLSVVLARAGSPRRSVQEAALRELVEAGAPARDAARRALASPNVDTRRGAAAALALIADDSCAPEIIEALQRADDLDAPSLILALGRTTAAASGAALVGFIEGPDELRAFRSAAAASAFAGQLDLARLRAATSPERPAHVRQAALIALGGHSQPSDFEFFLAASKDALAPVREASAQGLFASGLATTGDVRRLVVEDDHERVRAAAAKAARALGRAAIVPLAEALRRFRDDDTVPAAIASLAAIREPAAFDALHEFALDDTQTSDERGAAVRGLDAIDHDLALTVLKREAAIFDMDLRVYCDEILATETRR